MHALFFVLSIAGLLDTIHCTSFTPGNVVNLGHSFARSVKCELTANRVFFGIPYALPPLDDLRFAPPLPGNFTGLISTPEPRSGCLQFGLANILPGTQSEDWYAKYLFHLSRSVTHPR